MSRMIRVMVISGMAADILIVSNPRDLHAMAVSREIERRGKTCKILNTEWRDDSPLYYKIGKHGSPVQETGLGDTEINAATTLWWRRPYNPISNENVADLDKDFVRAEKKMGLLGMFFSSGCRIINRPEREYIANNKPFQLQMALQAGFNVPLTCITNNGEEARTFINELNNQGKRVIFKTLTVPKNSWAPTQLITIKQVLDEELSLAPVIFQECIERGIDLRICVVGQNLFSASIRSNYPELIDWRLDPMYKTEHYELDERTKSKIREFMRIIGLDTGSIDLRIAPDGETYFFEVNPSGQFLWLEADLGLPISASLVDLLLH